MEGGPPIQLNCVADGEPKPNITWTKINNGSDGDIVFTGENFVLPNNRSNAGTYRCNASNDIGNDVNQIATVVVNFKPENFMFKVESTNENICKGDPFNITCSAEGSPAVHTYQLFEDGVLVQTSNNYSRLFWNKETVGGILLYTCDANNTVSTANTTRNVTVNVSSSIQTISDKVVREGGDLTLFCDASGIPKPLVLWVNVHNNERTDGNTLAFENITRYQAGEWRCEASNPCGNATESATIDVQFEPEMVQLFASKATVCIGSSVILNCSAYGNPVVHTYHLYENENMVEEISSTGVWTRTMSTGGEFVFKCMVNNTVGTAMSPNVPVTVNEPSFIRPFTKKNIIEEEEEDLTIMCEANGTPPPNVSWVKTSDGERTFGKQLVFADINRNKAGEYRCEASNLCGNASESVEIDVFFKPEMVQLFASEETVNYGASITFNCSAYSHPMVHTYHLYENGNMVEQISSTGVWTRTMSTGGEFVFSCMVNNTVGTAMSANVSVTVNEKCVPDCTGKRVCLALGTKHFCSCPYGKTGESCEQNGMKVYVMILIQSNPVNKDTEGTMDNVRINVVSVLRGLCKLSKIYSTVHLIGAKRQKI
ncbi:immunoglobulin superfamily member 10-like [Montipora capricornis]|uniref:immunoglobulin superfamily member 10-like n=1 Tax=Montipora capricornis TaxID=246305 RepID=UPI0035F112FE